MLATPELVFLKPRIEEFIKHCKARNLSPKTIHAYSADLAKFVAISGGSEITIDQITRKLVRRFTVQLYEAGQKASSVRRRLAAVKSFCRWLEAEGLLKSNLIGSITGPRRRHELPDVVKQDEVKKLIEGEISGSSPKRDRLVLELLYGCGIRASELTGINLDDFRDEDVLLVRGKGKKERLVIYGEPAKAALSAWIEEREALLQKSGCKTSALLFRLKGNESDGRLDVRSVGRILKAVAESRGLDPKKFHPHALRHACASHMHDRGAPLQAIATLLGHSRLSTAQIYTRCSVSRMMQSYNSAHPHARI